MIDNKEGLIINRAISKDETKIVKAVAIILMLIHHLWGFPDRIADGGLKYIFTILGHPSTIYLGCFGKICVSLFFFLGGYGNYISYYDKEFDIVQKIKKLYLEYWKVFVIFIPIGFAFFSNQVAWCEDVSICNKYSSFSFEELFCNFLGLRFTYNCEWWFLNNYIFAIIMFPLIRNIVNKLSLQLNIFLAVIYSIFITNVLPAMGQLECLGYLNHNYLYSKFLCQNAPFGACFLMGVIVARYGVIDKLREQLDRDKMLNPIADVIGIIIIIYLRQTGIGNDFDIFYVPFFIVFVLDFVNRINILKRLLMSFGRQSTNMWLLHSFCCYYFYSLVRIVVFPKWALASLFVLIIMTYAICVLLDKLWLFLFWVISKLSICR